MRFIPTVFKHMHCVSPVMSNSIPNEQSLYSPCFLMLFMLIATNCCYLRPYRLMALDQSESLKFYADFQFSILRLF